MVLGDVEETVSFYEIDDETYEENFKVRIDVHAVAMSA